MARKDSLSLQVDDKDLRRLFATFNKMDDIAKNDIKRIATQIAERNAQEVRAAAESAPNSKQAVAVASAIESVSSSKDPTIKLYRNRRVTSDGLQAGYLFSGSEFGATQNRTRTRKSGTTYLGYNQFPPRSPIRGRGSEGYWLYKTLRRRQPDILKEWLESYKLIRDAWIGRF